jgi:hypothetical protein
LNLDIKPNKQIVTLGDTIWIEGKIPTQMQDLETGDYADFSGLKLGIVTYIGKFTTNNTSDREAAAYDFNYLPELGKITENIQNGPLHTSRDIECVEIANHYQFKIGLIAQKIGTYVITFVPWKISRTNIGDCGQTANVSYFIAVQDRHWALYMSHFPVQSGADPGDVYTFEVADTE